MIQDLRPGRQQDCAELVLSMHSREFSWKTLEEMKGDLVGRAFKYTAWESPEDVVHEAVKENRVSETAYDLGSKK